MNSFFKNTSSRKAYFSIQKFISFSFFYVSKPIFFFLWRFKYDSVFMQQFYFTRQLLASFSRISYLESREDKFRKQVLSFPDFVSKEHLLFYFSSAKITGLNILWHFLSRREKHLIKIYKPHINHVLLHNISMVFNLNVLVKLKYYLFNAFLHRVDISLHRLYIFQKMFILSRSKNYLSRISSGNVFNHHFYKRNIIFFNKV